MMKQISLSHLKLRITKDDKTKLQILADFKGMSLNKLVEEALKKEIKEHETIIEDFLNLRKAHQKD